MAAAGGETSKPTKKMRKLKETNCPANLAISLILVLHHEADTDPRIRYVMSTVSLAYCRFDDNFIVTSIAPHTFASKRAYVGDRIFAVNNEITKAGTVTL